MEIKFDSYAAVDMINTVYNSCKNIQGNMQEIINLSYKKENWDDVQLVAFQENISEITREINHSLAKESEYLTVFKQRVDELRGI